MFENFLGGTGALGGDAGPSAARSEGSLTDVNLGEISFGADGTFSELFSDFDIRDPYQAVIAGSVVLLIGAVALAYVRK